MCNSRTYSTLGSYHRIKRAFVFLYYAISFRSVCIYIFLEKSNHSVVFFIINFSVTLYASCATTQSRGTYCHYQGLRSSSIIVDNPLVSS
uniref:Uncharacterized protein n=1 Tax=Arundo donax TaxID=35708 RepID=A0A0A9CAE0_ARUDO